jgi:hypothetical protein
MEKGAINEVCEDATAPRSPSAPATYSTTREATVEDLLPHILIQPSKVYLDITLWSLISVTDETKHHPLRSCRKYLQRLLTMSEKNSRAEEELGGPTWQRKRKLSILCSSPI